MDIFDTFRASANPEQAVKMKSYMRDQFDYLGIQTPLRRKLSRDVIKMHKDVDWSFIFKCWKQPEREFQYLAIDCLDRVKSALSSSDILNLKRLIIEKSWWDTVDGIDVIVGGIALRHPEVSGDENELLWLDVNGNFFDMSRFAGEGNIGHIYEIVKQNRPELD